jgi:antitoxin component of MazEF toxin-antitoxin module
MKKLLKICSLPQGRGYVPGINLKGLYLKEFGFCPGEFVNIEVAENQIIITRTDTTKEVSEMAVGNPALAGLIEAFDLTLI